MRSNSLILIAICCALPLAVRAQISTNLPTEIQNFETQTDAVIVKGFGETGTMTTDAGEVSVRCKESDNLGTSQKQYAIAIVLESNQGRIFLPVDYDELDDLQHGLNFLSKISYNVTEMPSFDASFATRSGFRAVAHSERRQSAIELFIQFGDTLRIPLTSDQFAQFQNLVSQARTSLDALRSKNSSS